MPNQTNAPTIAIGPGNPEALKYGRLWARPEYRQQAPGEALASRFLAIARPAAGADVIDFGCGTGRGALMLAILGSLKVTLVDFVRNCLDEEVRQALSTQAHMLRFIKADLESPIPTTAPYGYCTDVMEHIPPERVDRVLANILRSAQHVFFSIALGEDACGALIGEPLHLTVRPYAWWLERFRALEAVVHWAEVTPTHALFYVTAWQSGAAIVAAGQPNTENAEIRANVRANLQGGWQELHPHPTNDLEVVILGGGPSLANQEAEIRGLVEGGAKLVTLNGAYGWALAHGLGPVTQIMVDARAFNARFVQPIRPDCMYLMASQCHPTVLDGLPRDRTWLWHASPSVIGDILDERGTPWHFVPGGSSVLLRAIPLLRMLGYRRFHLFGCDSCVMEGAHHAYAQPENEAPAFPVIVEGGARFWCQVWMISQAQEFQDLIRVFGDEIELAVYGDGLLAHILRTGAAMAAEEG